MSTNAPARQARAAVCRSFGEPLVIEELSVRAPLGDELLIRVKACAICHSDIAYSAGAWGGVLPAVFGHEAAGVVEELGSGVRGLEPGDHVVATLIRSCGACRRCREGRPALCEGSPDDREPVLRSADGEPVHQAMRTGSFSELVTVHASQVVRIPPDLDLEVASLLACGVMTGVGAVLNTARVKEGESVVVLGAGGVGLSCVQGAAIAGAEPVVAIDLVARKLEVAKNFGATSTVDTSVEDAPRAVERLTAGRGPDHVFVAAGIPRLVEQGAAMLGRGGTLVVVGIPPEGTQVRLDPVAVADGSLRILGSKMGDSDPRRDIPRFVEWYRQGRLKLDELISERVELERINEAIDSAERGEQLRPVVVFGGVPGGR